MNIASAQIAANALAASELTPAQNARQARLADAAQQFEGMMMQELLKPMQAGKDGDESGGGGFGTGDADRDTSLDTISSYGTEAVAAAIAKHGGLGIAKQVMREIGIADGQHRK
jgi:flagellar protein FlgJ